jgi:arylsulfatase A-like enzyme
MPRALTFFIQYIPVANRPATRHPKPFPDSLTGDVSNWHDTVACHSGCQIAQGANFMRSRISGFGEPGLASSSPENRARARLGSFSILVLSAWCGLVAGLLEVGITILRKKYVDVDHFYGMSRDFVWLVPSVNLLVFVVLGVILSWVARMGARGQKVATQALATLALIPPFWAVFPRIYGVAGLLLMMGVAAKLVPAVERRAAGFSRVIRLTFPLAFSLLMALAALCWVTARVKEWREASSQLPAPSSPNILLIVLDTVGASHLSLLGYNRPTSPTIEELASRGISFNRAQATASWTLPSHASIFTGRWPHELSTGWLTPLDASFPTVAEYLRERGYSTAGFVANLSYCASDSGLARGFTTYRDFSLRALTALHVAVIVDRLVDGFQDVESFCTDRLKLPFLRIPSELVWQLFAQERKEAAVINGEFLDWLSNRRQPERPFFAFLNFYDAHHPYQLPSTGIHRFGMAPSNDRERAVIRDWPEMVKHEPSARQIAFARDSYDDCVTGLDEQLGQLIDELKRRAVLERTWVIVTADHGESFGEHPGVFLHGATLYQTERHVPLVIVAPGGDTSRQVVTVPVSLRDLAATIVGISGFNAGSPFPGVSLVRARDASPLKAISDGTGASPALSELAHEIPPYSSSPEYDVLRWPLAALVEGDWSYIRRDGERRELLFNLREDAGELHNRANEPAILPTLERMREALDYLTAGRLTPDRFNP